MYLNYANSVDSHISLRVVLRTVVCVIYKIGFDLMIHHNIHFDGATVSTDTATWSSLTSGDGFTVPVYGRGT